MLPIVVALRSVLRERHDLALAVLFGSHAKEKEHPESDLDVAVLPNDAFSAASEAELADALWRATGREVDLIRLDRIDDAVLRKEIASGVPVYETEPGTFARFAAEATLAWLDLEPVYLAAQARFLRRIAGTAGRP